MSSFYLRTESIKQSDILDLSVINDHDKSILSALSSPEPCLLEGSRGTGKSFLMRIAELEIENADESFLPVFVSFNISSLLQTDDPLQFYHWMLAKALKALVNKLRKKGYLVSVHSANLLSNDESSNEEKIEQALGKIVKEFEDSYRRDKGKVEIHLLPDIEDVKEAIESICQENNLERIYFFFDEAAHVFRPEQQRQFFNLFKDLRSPYITCNAAIYPGVTYFGGSFEPTHDCVYKRIERDIRDSDYLIYFKQIVYKQADDLLKTSIDNNLELFNTLAFSCGGNPRILLRTIQELEKFNTKSVNETIKTFYRDQIWTEHTELGDKYKGHKHLIDWGRDFLEKYVIPAIEQYNENRKERNVNESSIYFWVHKDCLETVKESLRLLSYTSVLRKIDSAIRATRSELGSRYEVKYGCILALTKNPVNDSKKLYECLISKNFPEFGKNHIAYKDIKDLGVITEDESIFHDALENMLKKPIDVLQLLTHWQKDKLKEAGINTIEELHQNTEENLIEKIYNVGPVRARLIKNAATAELLEYLSG
ncbi:MAG: hypothetical protein KME07_05365 [Pegethrix bostrychoides GSE-TBD4-15B]|jgi:hypothetical protein|uniref:RNA polymerase alpha subunit C-terminal domain-containing protein n=1 Tax=Pegethrix bostrychoides GSE-TBD4-15B TaxID=2839662 RepID=A0A951P832_9CYAN|nr:hypothetical protein [Pegethrix bostrychoides GSE-TBD4-15B]